MQRVRIRRRQRNRQFTSKVGTEAVAVESLERNRRRFQYPDLGFVSPIEYSLLYSMISMPEVYPASSIEEAITDEDFTEYLELCESDELSSYAQLTALMAVAVEKWPIPKKQQVVDSVTNVPQFLCKALLQTVVKHAEVHSLDREKEVVELLSPLEKRLSRKHDKRIVVAGLPQNIGFVLSVLLANPLPIYLGYMVGYTVGGTVMLTNFKEKAKFKQLNYTSSRMATEETTSLLDDV